MQTRSLAKLVVCLCGLSCSSQAFAQFTYKLPTFPAAFFLSRPHYETVQVSQVLSSQALGGGITRFTCRTPQGTNISVDVTPDVWPSFFLYPAGVFPIDPSADFVQVAAKVLTEIQQGNLYDVTFESLWINPYFQPASYRVNAMTRINFAQRTVQQYNGVETVVSGYFDDANADEWGHFILRRYSSSGTISDLKYPLARRNNIDGCTIDALRLTDNLYNYGLLNLIESTVRDGAVEIDDYCSGNSTYTAQPDPTMPAQTNPVRIVHRGSEWHL